MLFLLVLTLSFNLPAFEPDSLGCVEGTVPETGLSIARLYVNGAPIDSHSVVGQEGMQDSFTFEEGTGTEACVTLVDSVGNISCPVCKPIGPVGVGDVIAPAKIVYYDLLGRRTIPTKSGIYFTNRRRIILFTGTWRN